MKKDTIILVAVLTAFLFSCQKKQEQSATVSNETKIQDSNPGKQESQTASYSQQGMQTQGSKKYVKNENYFLLPSCSGKDVDLKDYAGRPVLIVFFTENCPYCKEAALYIEKMYQKYSSAGLAVIGISMKDSVESARKFASELKLTFPIAYRGAQIGKNYHVQGVPFIFLLDRNHNNYDTWIGYDPSYDGDIDVTIERVLK